MNRNRPCGFTLIEMVITLVVFLLLVASVFGIITAVLQTTDRLADNQGREDQNTALQAFLRLHLDQIPAEGTLITYHRDGDPSGTSGLIWGDTTELTALDTLAQPNGLKSVRLTHYFPSAKLALQASVTAFQNSILQDDASLTWIPLAHDLKLFDWKFQAEGVTTWDDHWANGLGIVQTGSNTGPFFPKPNLIELTFQNSADLQPVTLDLWLPRVEPIQVTIEQQAPVSATGATSLPHAP